MSDRRQKDAAWYVADECGRLYERINDGAILATLMDIRSELKLMNTVLQCHNTIEIPSILRDIRANTKKKRKLRRKR